MDTPILEDVLANLDRTKGQWPTIAEKSGVPYKTLVKIAQRETLNPGVNGVQQLYDYFHGIDRADSSDQMREQAARLRC